ncbi:ROK family transcriptional regulator [Gracilibacillus massiliensis]|uniref:ROK family transcriptional regulator n=1 Tax=Gracilibacillus massiliensis TaxID=1564956 RepID=UPI00071DB79E|nr:ROK family transcriptional regulator [Gracilibacillus massiliensis]
MYNTTQRISKDMMKQYNQKLILRILMKNGATSKSTLAKQTGLTLPAIADIVDKLENYQLIKNIGASKTDRGRFPTLYDIEEKTLKVIGVGITSKHITIGIYNLKGEKLVHQSEDLPHNTSPEPLINKITLVINHLLQKKGFHRSEFLGIGVGMHGIVDYQKGVAIYPPHLDWENVPIKEQLERAIDLPVLVDNDCNALTLAESWFGDAKEENSFIVVNVDYGIGAGIMIDRKIFHGIDFGAGQIGHTIVDGDGPLCTCGNYGCLEALASEASILEQIQKKMKKGFPTILHDVREVPDDIMISDVYEALIKGDALVLNVVEEAARYVGIAVSTLVNIINPEKIILTGSLISNASKETYSSLVDSFAKHALKTNTKKLEVVKSNLMDHTIALGAASQWINELLLGSLSLKREMGINTLSQNM